MEEGESDGGYSDEGSIEGSYSGDEGVHGDASDPTSSFEGGAMRRIRRLSVEVGQTGEGRKRGVTFASPRKEDRQTFQDDEDSDADEVFSVDGDEDEEEAGQAGEIDGERGPTQKQIAQLFSGIDDNSNGLLEMDEISQLAEMLGQDLDEVGLEEAMADMDADGTGAADLDEFTHWFVKSFGAHPDDPPLGAPKRRAEKAQVSGRFKGNKGLRLRIISNDDIKARLQIEVLAPATRHCTDNTCTHAHAHRRTRRFV